MLLLNNSQVIKQLWQKTTMENKIPILVSTKYGYGWSTTVFDNEIKRIMMTNVKLVDYVIKCKNSNRSPLAKDVRAIWLENFPDITIPELRGVHQLSVSWVTKGQPFQVKHFHGAEYIYLPSDDPNWFIA